MKPHFYRIQSVDARIQAVRQSRKEKKSNSPTGNLSWLAAQPSQWRSRSPEISEQAATWGFAWLPPIEEFLEDVEEGLSKTEFDTENKSKLWESGSRRTYNFSGGDSSSSEGSPGIRRSRQRKRRRAFNDLLVEDKGFQNPHSLDLMEQSFQIQPYTCGLVDVAQDGDWDYHTIREEQDNHWADEKVKKGIALAKSGDINKAFKKYDEALEMCPRHVAARIAKGAAFFNTGELMLACKEFTLALYWDPENVDAKTYLEETQKKMELEPLKEFPKDREALPSTSPEIPDVAISMDSPRRSAVKEHEKLNPARIKEILEEEFEKKRKRKKHKHKRKKKHHKKRKKRHHKKKKQKKLKKKHVAEESQSSESGYTSSSDSESIAAVSEKTESPL